MPNNAAIPDTIQPDIVVHEITLHVAPAEKLMKWWCINCRNFLFFSHHRLISISEDGPLEFLQAPITIICSRCRWHVHIQNII